MAQRVLHATHDAFIHGFTTAMVVSTSVAAIGAFVAFFFIDGIRKPQAAPAEQPEVAQAEALGV
jgi:hypothetical protein